jgi:hypothetical protein
MESLFIQNFRETGPAREQTKLGWSVTKSQSEPSRYVGQTRVQWHCPFPVHQAADKTPVKSRLFLRLWSETRACSGLGVAMRAKNCHPQYQTVAAANVLRGEHGYRQRKARSAGSRASPFETRLSRGRKARLEKSSLERDGFSARKRLHLRPCNEGRVRAVIRRGSQKNVSRHWQSE